MNFIDVISGNKFLKTIYPDGLTEDVLIGHVGFDFGARFSLNIHVKQKPKKEIPKWGKWGKDYNVIVMCFLGRYVENINISNLEKINFAPLVCSSADGKTLISSENDDWKISFLFDSLVFQNCQTYSM